MPNDFDNDENIGQSVLPVDVEEMAVPIPLKELQPWHRPRKQYVRERQWKACASHLIDRLRVTNAQSIRDGKLKYLTLPGIDHFDVEVIGEAARSRGLSLEATGFLSEAEKESVRARSEVRADSLIKNGVMEDTSITFPYRFENIASRNGQAYREVKDRAPFHIVNIDACGSIAPPTAQQPSRIINALFSLIELQFQRMADPWCLFLTTDARLENVSPDVMEAMTRAIRTNAANSVPFRDGATNALGIEGEDLENALVNANSNPRRFLNKFSLGLTKWLLHNANAQGWDLKSKMFFCYSTRLAEEDDASMPCLAFEFKKQPVVMEDLFGAVHNPAPQDNNEADYSIIALNRVQEMTNLDEYLFRNADVMTEFAVKQRQLLVGAGYTAEALQEFDRQFLGVV